MSTRMSSSLSVERPPYDQVLVDIADYVCSYTIESELAYSTARNCLIDTLGCGLEALEYPACTKLLGPVVPGTIVPNGAKVPGTAFQLDPVQAAFNIGAMIRWLDFNDTWLAAEWGHPSDNLGGILAVADWLSRTAVAGGQPPLTMRAVLTAMIKAHEIQGCLALENSFNKVGLDHVVLVKVATTAGSRANARPKPRVKSSMHSRWRGSTGRACGLTATPPTPVRARAGPPAMPPAVRFASPSWSGPERWVIPRCSPPGPGDSTMSFSRPALQLPAALRFLRDGECSVQDQLSGRVSRADRRRGSHGAARKAARSRKVRRGYQ